MVVVEVVRPDDEDDDEEEPERAVVVVVVVVATVDLFKLPVLVLAASPCSLAANALVPGLAPAATSLSSLV